MKLKDEFAERSDSEFSDARDNVADTSSTTAADSANEPASEVNDVAFSSCFSTDAAVSQGEHAQLLDSRKV